MNELKLSIIVLEMNQLKAILNEKNMFSSLTIRRTLWFNLTEGNCIVI